jgi:hypothetical protein
MPRGGFFQRLLPLSIFMIVLVSAPLGSAEGRAQTKTDGTELGYAVAAVAAVGRTETDEDHPIYSAPESSTPSGIVSTPIGGATSTGAILSGGTTNGATSTGATSAPDPIEEPEVGFTCTEPHGNILGCTNLSAFCSRWWPNCSRRSQIGSASIPSSCSSANFTVLQYVSGGGSLTTAPVISNLDSKSSFNSKSHGPVVNDLGSTNGSGVTASFAMPGSKATSLASSSQGDGATASSPNSGNAAFTTADSSAPIQASTALPNRGKVGGSEVRGGPTSAIEGADVSSTRFADPSAPAPASASASYSDPALAYSVTSGSRETLVEKLKASPGMREELRAKLREASATADPAKQETLEYYKKALVEAESRVRGGSLNALTPLGAREAFSMNGEDSEREIGRLTVSMSSASEDELTQTPLFPRVHKALLRQMAMGKLKVIPKPTLSASAP